MCQQARIVTLSKGCTHGANSWRHYHVLLQSTIVHTSLLENQWREPSSSLLSPHRTRCQLVQRGHCNSIHPSQCCTLLGQDLEGSQAVKQGKKTQGNHPVPWHLPHCSKPNIFLVAPSCWQLHHFNSFLQQFTNPSHLQHSTLIIHKRSCFDA